MALRRLTTGAALLLALLPALAHAAAAPTSAQIVVYRGAVTNAPGQTRKRERELGFVAAHRYRRVIEGFAARLTSAQIQELRSDPDVAQVVPDRPVFADSAPLVPGGTLPVGLTRIGAARNGLVREASGAAVAVIDTGIDLTNPDLNVVAGTNCMGDGPPNDDNGHGTHVAGTIGARNDGVDAVGVAPGTQVYAVKVLGAAGQGSESSIICGLDWVAENARSLGIKVANMSLGGSGAIGNCTSEPEHTAVCQVVGAGVTVVVAAGNEGDQISSASGGHVPAGYPEVLTVTAMADTDGRPGGLGPGCADASDDALAPFSNFAGPADADHTIAGPGDCVVSSARGGGVTTLSGTSMATPHVAAAAALCIDEAGAPGPCAGLPPAGVISALRAAAAAGATQQNGFVGDPLHPVAAGYYGYLVRAGVAPVADTGAADVLGETEASLAGTIDANGGDAAWWFDLGPAAGSYDQATAAQTGTPGADPVPVQGSATGLDPGTTYHYRTTVVVDGWTAHGPDKTFTTPGTPPPPPPDTTIDAAPASLSTTGFAELRFTAAPAGAAAFECRLDSPDWAPCASPLTYDDVGDGRHTFSVRAVGVAGKRDPTPAAVTWTVDRTPPDTKIAGAPTDPTSSTSATFGVSGSESGSAIACRLDAAPWAPCGQVVKLSGLAPGRHRFEARATDAVGLTDPTPAFYEWTVRGATDTPGPAPPAGSEAPPEPVNPLAPAQPGPALAPFARLRTIGPARIDRRRSRLTLTIACAGPGPCAGQLSVLNAGRRIASGPVRLAAAARAVIRFRIGPSAGRRLPRRLPSRAALSLSSAAHTALANGTIGLLTDR